MSKASKKKQDPNRVGSGSKNEKESNNSSTASGLNTANSAEAKARSRTYPLWPEFSDADINVEKWDNARSVKERGKSPSSASAQALYDDIEGKIEMPSNMQVYMWSRLPQELSASKSFVVVENEEDFDLINYSKHLCCYPLMRMIMSQITLLWNIECARKIKTPKERPRMASSPELTDDGRWKPWEHIYSMCKSGRGHMPLYNPTGKYVVRLYYMGCWRKIVIDDQMPYNVDSQLLLPTSAHKNELWPMLLSKALIKIASINYKQGANSNDLRLAEFSVIHALTGWLPEITPLCPIAETWEFMKKLLPNWKYPTDVKEEECVAEAEEGHSPPVAPSPGLQTAKNNDVKGQSSSLKKMSKDINDSVSSKHMHKDGKKRGTSDSLRERQKSDSDNAGEFLYATPETVVFATFDQPVPNPAPLSDIKNMADGSEVLRNIGLSQMMCHPILVRKTRDLPLIPEQVKPPVPLWQTIRPRPKPSDPGEKVVAKKPDMWLEVSSPFLHMPKHKPDHKSNIFNSSLHGLDENEEQEDQPTTQPEKSAEEPAVVEEVKLTAEQERCGVWPSAGANDPKDKLKAKAKGGPINASVANMNKDKVAENSASDSRKTNSGEKTKDSEITGNLHLNNEYMMPTDADFIKSVWMDFDDFCKTFKNMIVFHKPNTYRYNSNSSEYKPTVLSGLGPPQGLVPPSTTTGSGKKSAAQPSAINLHTSKHASPSSIFTTVETTTEKPMEETEIHNFLMVDSVNASEIIICLSSLVYWPGVDIKSLSQMRDSVAGENMMDSKKSFFSAAGKAGDPSVANEQPLFQGHVVVEPYSWVDCKVHQPILNIKTNGVFATALLLPPGRHVLRLNISFSYGHHIQLLSTTPFTYGDEDAVLPLLKEESARFKVVARDIASTLDQLIAAMGNTEKWKKVNGSLRKYYEMKYDKSSPMNNEIHKEAFYSSLFALMEKILPEQKEAREVKHLFQAITLHFDSLSYRQDNTLYGCTGESSPSNDRCASSCRPASGMARYDRSHYLANLKIQKHLRGYNVRKTLTDHRKQSVRDTGPIATFRSTLKSNLVQYGSFLLRQMLKYEPELIEHYDFCDDESKKVCFTEYSEAYNEQPANHWFVVARGVFFVEEASYCVPKLYGISNKCLLHVVNNDTGAEVRRVFNRPVPHLYTKNQNGYTFAAELKTYDTPLPAGKWKMKLLGPETPQLAPVNGIVESNFQMKELRGYYIPNSNNVIFRYVVQCKVSQLTSIQIETSDNKVQFLLQIFNKGKVIATRKAKGYLFVPYCYFVGKTTPKVETEVAAPVQTNDKTSKAKGGKAGKAAVRAHSPKEETKKKERRPTIEDDEEVENRLYYIQLTVLNHSWRLDEEQLAHIDKLKGMECQEMKLTPEPEKEEPKKECRPRTKMKKSAKEAAAKEREGKELASKASSHAEVSFDTSKAYWSMRVVCDADRIDDIDIRKDRSRLKEIKAMKQAWEAMEEGRSLRAKESREKYLKSLRQMDPDKKSLADDGNEEEEEEEQLETAAKCGRRQSTLPPLEINSGDNPPKEPYIVGVICPFTKKAERRGSTFYNVNELNNVELERRAKLDQEEAERLKSCEEKLQANSRERSLLKEQLMEECFELQLQTDLYRTRLFKPRNDYRQGLLDDLKFEQEKAAAAAAAAMETAAIGADSAKESRKSKSSKSSKKKK